MIRNWAVDRILHVQIHRHTGTDRGRRAQKRYERLLERAEPMLKDLQRHWKSFISGKVDAYSNQVRALEDYVAATVQLFRRADCDGDEESIRHKP